MRSANVISICVLILIGTITLSCDGPTVQSQASVVNDSVNLDPIISHVVDLSSSQLNMYWKNDSNEIIRTFPRLNKYIKKRNQELVFAMNGGMFTKEFAPLGLYIDKGYSKTPIKTSTTGYGNFYMQPNGVFYITKDNKANVVTTQDFKEAPNIKYATQSGPMLISGGKINSNFGENSTSLHIRNGVGILPDGNVLFAISRERVNFHSFADFFKNKGCTNALYLDGFVSRVYLPSQGFAQMNGNFGVLIGEVKPNR